MGAHDNRHCLHICRRTQDYVYFMSTKVKRRLVRSSSSLSLSDHFGLEISLQISITETSNQRMPEYLLHALDQYSTTVLVIIILANTLHYQQG